MPGVCDIFLGDDASGDIDGDLICADRDGANHDGAQARVVFADDFESGDVSAWGESAR